MANTPWLPVAVCSFLPGFWFNLFRSICFVHLLFFSDGALSHHHSVAFVRTVAKYWHATTDWLLYRPCPVFDLTNCIQARDLTPVSGLHKAPIAPQCDVRVIR